MFSDVAGNHDSKSQESTGGDFGAPHCSYFFSYSYSASRYSYSERTSIAIRTIGLQVTANRLDHRSPQFKQPSSTSTVSLSTSTTKSDARTDALAPNLRGYQDQWIESVSFCCDRSLRVPDTAIARLEVEGCEDYLRSYQYRARSMGS